MSSQALPVQSDPREDLLEELLALYADICSEADSRLVPYRARYPDGFPEGARNLADYLALRSHDLRPLQQRLINNGLSSLGRGESRVRANLERVIEMLRRASGDQPGHIGPDNGVALLETNTGRLFGTRNATRYARIMVTLPPGAASEPELLQQLIANGMDVARINCAHDTPDTWLRMIENVRHAATTTGKQVRVFMDLAGHKIRTGPIQPGPAVLHLQVQRDAFGRQVAPARVELVASVQSHAGDLPQLPVAPELLAQLQPGHSLHCNDTRDKYRVLQVRKQRADGNWLAECDANAYIVPGTALRWQGVDADGNLFGRDDYSVGAFSGKPQAIHLQRDDALLLACDNLPGSAATGSRPARIGCTYPDVVGLLQAGDSVWFDDGKLGCKVTRIIPEGAMLQVTHAGPQGVRLRSDKGINLPGVDLPLPPLTEKDLADLDFVCAHADCVAFSFVRTLDEVDRLRCELASRGRPDLPFVLKIETVTAVNNLPDLLLGSLGGQALGVMIARGDLAIELGSVRMAEIQEEILWICEAAHIPVIWATQVLDTLARKGVISRPEITDAAMSVRAECVMLNKGSYITDAVTVLDDILTRMDAHQYKKISRLRRLALVGSPGPQ